MSPPSKCADSSYGEYISFTSVVNSKDLAENDEEINEGEAKKTYKNLYNKYLQVDKLNKESEHQKIVLTKKNLSLKAMYTERETLCLVLQQELNEVKEKA